MKTKYKIILLLLLWFAAFIPIYPSLFNTWINHSDNSQCLFAPLFAGYFVWQKREQLKVAPLANSDWGGLILILSMAFYLLSFAGGISCCRQSHDRILLNRVDPVYLGKGCI